VAGPDGVTLAGDPELVAAAAGALPADAEPGRPFAAPDSTSQPEFESGAFPAALRAAGAPLAVPLGADGARHGWLLVGEKLSERRFVEQDLALVTAAGAAAAAALGRIELVRRAAAEEARSRRLDEIDRLKSDFLSRVAHDLRTPLTSIAWSADNLLDGLAGPLDARQHDYLRSMKAATGQLGRLVGNLLEISRLEVGCPRIAIVPVDLPAVVGEAALALAPVARERGIAIRVVAPAGLPPVRGDGEKLGEIVINLLENAVRYSPGGSEVEVALAGGGGAGGTVVLSVRDRGPGLAAGEEAFVFERFRQGRPSPYVAQSGFGLGLYVVKSYVELMGGGVTARNRPGGGAEFACGLPACP
jgi:signal transduction histidine kinase